ncbi:MAG: AAA family ATPase [Aquincola tertiaricarbonis]
MNKTPATQPADWRLFRGDRTPHDGIHLLPPPPPWRPFRTHTVAWERRIPADDALPPAMRKRGRTFQSTQEIVELVNAALYLRRPLLVTGNPGSGKSSLVDAIAWELRLGEPLRWSVTSRSTLRDALYSYDAVGRLHATQQARSEGTEQAELPLSQFLRLGPLGTALLPTDIPRALLIDEIDKADLDLPNDLLNVLEEGEFEVPELARQKAATVAVRLHGGGPADTYPVTGGRVQAKQFPLVVFTSNGEREFSPAFLRRCLRLDMPDPCKDPKRLSDVVQAHLAEYFTGTLADEVRQRIDDFARRAATERLATDQLLNAVLLVVGRAGLPADRKEALVKAVTQPLA